MIKQVKLTEQQLEDILSCISATIDCMKNHKENKDCMRAENNPNFIKDLEKLKNKLWKVNRL